MSEVSFQNIGFVAQNTEVTSLAAAVAAGGSLAASTTYYYKITTVTGIGQTTGSSEVSDTTTSTDKTINLTWTEVSDESSAILYRVYRGTASGTYSGYFNVEIGETSFSDDGTTALITTDSEELFGGRLPLINTSAGSVFGGTSPINIVGGFGDDVSVGLLDERPATIETYSGNRLEPTAIDNVDTTFLDYLTVNVDRSGQSAAKTFIVIATVAAASPSTTSVGIELDIDGTAYSALGNGSNLLITDSVAGLGLVYTFTKRISLDESAHTVSLQYKTGGATQDITLSGASITVFEEPADTQASESETIDVSGATTTEITKATLTFTPGVEQDYLLLCYADVNLEDWSQSDTGFKFKHGATELVTMWTGSSTSRDVFNSNTNDNRYVPFAGMKVVTLAASSQTFTLTYQGGGTSGEAKIGNARIYAVPLGDILNYQAAGESEVAIDDTSFATVLTTSPTLQSGEHTILSFNEIANQTMNKYSRSQLSIDSGDQLMTGYPVRGFEDNGASDSYYPEMRVYTGTFTSGSKTFVLQGSSEDASAANSGIFRRNRIVVLDFNRSSGGTTTSGSFKVKDYDALTLATMTKAEITKAGVLKLYGSTSGSVGLKGAAAAGSTTYTLPSADGSDGHVLTTDGSGTLAWEAAASAGAPTDATYVTLSTNATLTNERVLTGTANQITVTDGGAGTTVTLSTPQNIHTAATPQFAALKVGASTSGYALGIANTASTIGIDDAGATTTAGALLTIKGAAGGTSGTGAAGGGITATAGNAGGDNTVSRAGGAITITAGNSKGSSTGGAITITAGVGGVGTAATGAAGGAVTIVGGTGGVNTTPGAGGTVTVQGGAAAATAGAAGGAVTIAGRVGSSTGSGGDGGALNLNAGDANGDNTTDRFGGTITVNLGNSKGRRGGGAWNVNGGTGGTSTTANGLGAPASSWAFSSGGNTARTDGVAGLAGSGGSFAFIAGAGGNSSGVNAATNTGGDGGALTFNAGTGGNATNGTTNNGGAGGTLLFRAGAGGTGASADGLGGVVSFSTAATTSQTIAMTINRVQNVGIGTQSPSARLHVISTTEQLRVGYDTSNYYSTTVGSTGGVTFDAVGAGAGFTFSDDVSVPDEAYGSGWNANTEVPTKNAVYDKVETVLAHALKKETGRYYSAPAQGITTRTPTLAENHAIPVYFPDAVTLDRIGVEVTTGGGVGSVLRLGIYNDSGSGRPGTLLLDAGTVASTTTGHKEITISQAITPGLYWLAVAAQVGTVPVLRAFTGTNSLPQPTAPTYIRQCFSHYGVTGAFGTFDTTPDLDAGEAPYVQVRIA